MKTKRYSYLNRIYKISLILAYYNKELKEWADKIKEEKAKSNF